MVRPRQTTDESYQDGLGAIQGALGCLQAQV